MIWAVRLHRTGQEGATTMKYDTVTTALAAAASDRCVTCETRTLEVVDVAKLDGGFYWRIQCTTCKLYVYRNDLDDVEASHE